MKDLDHEMHVVTREFQPEFYGSEYPDIAASGRDPLRHFCEVGWREGRNPNPRFDVISYLQENSDVAEAEVNPFYHYLFHGRSEGRAVSPAVRPSVRTRLLFGVDLVDWVECLRTVVNNAYYQANLDKELRLGVDPVAHFAYWGWRNGKNPSATLDIRRLRAAYAEASRLLINPCIAEYAAAKGLYSFSKEPLETLEVIPEPSAILASERGGPDNRILEEKPDPAAVVRAHFEYEYYLNRNTDVKESGIDAFEHYIFTGWRENRSPNADFDPDFYRKNYADDVIDGINPFEHYLTVGKAKGYLPLDAVLEQPSTAASEQYIRDVVRTEFSEEYYLSTYADVRKAGVEALEHFLSTGWREHRNPNPSFDTAFYLSRNADIRDLVINPFWHYLVAGRAEGRLPARPGGYRRDLIENAHTAALKRDRYTQTSGRNLSEKELMTAVTARAKGMHTKGAVLSLSHDCYVRVVGGTQIFISDEQKLFNEYGFCYLHISPKHGQLALAVEGDNDEFLIAVNGAYVGAATMRILLKVLKAFLGKLGSKEKYLVQHSFFGFTPTQIISVAAVLEPQRTFFWAHDYSAVCEGYNLLRNDLQFCGAPPPTSMVCRVCRYGSGRLEHIKHVKNLFDSLKFEVLAPSARAADIWRKGVQFKIDGVRPHPHWVLKEKPMPVVAAKKRKDTRKANRSTKTPDTPIRAAFIGYPNANKGWQLFKELVEQTDGGTRGIQFYHLAANDTPSHPECTFVVTEVTPEDRTRAIANLLEHKIDVVCMLSPWPETFSFVSHEAIMAGIRVACLADSGNVAALATNGYRVSVFADPQALRTGLQSPDFRQQIEADRRVQHRYDAIASGATVSVVREVQLERLPQVSL